MKIEEQSNSLVCQLEVGQELGFVNRGDPLDSPDLDNHQACHKQINPITDIDSVITIHDGQRQLPLNLNPSTRQLKRQAAFMCRLKQARTECGMDLHRGVDDLTTDIIEGHWLRISVRTITAEDADVHRD
jgi:hypothetical protein